MSITMIRPDFPLPPVEKITVKTANSARMEIRFTKGVRSVSLYQKSVLSGEPRVYVWDKEGLIELADALTQAAAELDKIE